MSNKIWLLLIIIAGYFAYRPLLHAGLFPVHDDTQTARIIQMSKALEQGIFPVRWVPDLGYGFGYPLFNFYAPLPYYFAGLSLLIIKDPIIATKLMYFVGIIIAGTSMFALVSNFVNKKGALLAAVIYLYAPYHAVQIYVRGAVGEYWAYGLLPLYVLYIYKVLKSPKLIDLVKGAVVIAVLVLCHNIISLLTIIFTFLVLILILLLSFSLRILKSLHACIKLCQRVAILLFLGLGLSAFFWIPAVFESGYTSVDSITAGGSDYTNHFLELDQLWDSPWGYAGSAPGRQDGMSFKLGKINILIALLSLYGMARSFKSETKTVAKKLVIFSLFVVALLSLFMMTRYSLPVWQYAVVILKYIQYPWRMLVFILLFLTAISSYTTTLFPSRWLSWTSVIFLSLLTIFLHGKYFIPQSYNLNSPASYSDSQYLKWQVSKISDEYLSKDFVRPQGLEEIPTTLISDNSTNYQIIQDNITKLNLNIVLKQSEEIIINRSYFPSWQLTENNIHIPSYSKNGKIAFRLDAGTHNLTLQLTNTRIQLIANYLSLVSLTIILYKYWMLRVKYAK